MLGTDAFSAWSGMGTRRTDAPKGWFEVSLLAVSLIDMASLFRAKSSVEAQCPKMPRKSGSDRVG